jgi:rhamnose utilization protein RhaD (predicted bifunctional aldolase and dehydrogenase)
VQVNLEPVLALFEKEDLSDTAVKDALNAARVDQSNDVRPSVETTFHALALTLREVNFVGHTHPTAVNSILCSQKAEEAIAGRLFPDEIVVCGPGPAYVPYIDPGLPLAKALKGAIERYQDKNGRSPKVILMQNHGLIALGKTADEVLRITAMYVKTARIILGTYALSGPQFLTQEDVSRIDSRPDEHYRRKMLKKG